MSPLVSGAHLAHQKRVNPAWHEQFTATHVPYGIHARNGDTLFVPERDRFSGTYIVGKTGMGKSGLIENLIVHDMKVGNAVIVIDPHGDLVTNCIGHVPQHRMYQTFVLDMLDEDFPFGVNLFADAGRITTDVERSQAIERIMHIFDLVWPETTDQHYLPTLLRLAAFTFLDNPGATLADMQRFLRKDEFRAALLQNVKDVGVREYWEDEYTRHPKPHEPDRRVEPLNGRLISLFTGRGLIRNIVGQRQNSIDFRKAIEERQIIFIKLPMRQAKNDAQFIGALLMAQLQADIFSFANVPEAQRPASSLYVDEFQNIANKDFGTLITEARKYKVKLNLAHQFREQIHDKDLRQATMTVRTTVCFQISPENAKEMARLFAGPVPSVHAEDVETNASTYLLDHGSRHPQVKMFIDTYLKPLHAHKRGNRVEITERHMNLVALILYGTAKANKQPNPQVDDPLIWLNPLLREVMVTGDAHLPIPREIVRGFANCGRGFFRQAGRAGQEKLGPGIRWPERLVVPAAGGRLHWARRPKTGEEQLYHFLFHLRMTLQALAHEPIGKPKPATPAVVAQMLTQLPERAAFVKSGEAVRVVYTENTPPRATGEDFQARLRFIREQTRQTYCRPRAEVERTFATAAAEADASTTLRVPGRSRWEEQ